MARADRRRSYVVILNNYGTPGPRPVRTVIGEFNTPQEALDFIQKKKQELHQTNRGESIGLTWEERKTSREERTIRTTHGPSASTDIQNCDELRAAIQKLQEKMYPPHDDSYLPPNENQDSETSKDSPPPSASIHSEYMRLERSYLIQEAFKLGCLDDIPDSWVIEFRIDDTDEYE